MKDAINVDVNISAIASFPDYHHVTAPIWMFPEDAIADVDTIIPIPGNTVC